MLSLRLWRRSLASERTFSYGHRAHKARRFVGETACIGPWTGSVVEEEPPKVSLYYDRCYRIIYSTRVHWRCQDTRPTATDLIDETQVSPSLYPLGLMRPGLISTCHF